VTAAARRPAELGGALRWATLDPSAPLPLVVAGTPAEWAGAAADPELPGLLAAHPAATIAVFEGDAPALAVAFDLAGPPAALEGWLAAFRRAPQACTVLARLLRSEDRSLLTESLAYSALQAGTEHRAWLAGLPERAAPEPGPRVRVEATAGGTTITLTRSARHNAFDSRMREELCDALDAARERPGEVLLRAEGPSFCSGGDLAEFGMLTDPVHAHLVRTGRSVAARMAGLGARTRALLHGWCIGAGVELTAFAARLVAAEDTRFRLPEAGFGLLPGAGGTVSLPARIGRQRTLDMAVTGRVLDARTALAWGLVDEVAPS
jgi:hypothetical protein